MGEEDDVVRPLAQQLRMVDGAGMGAENPDRLVAHLPAVAVRAVEESPGPSAPGRREYRELVDSAGCGVRSRAVNSWPPARRG